MNTTHDPINRRQFSRDLLKAIHPCEQQQQQQQTSWLTFRIKLISKCYHIMLSRVPLNSKKYSTVEDSYCSRLPSPDIRSVGSCPLCLP